MATVKKAVEKKNAVVKAAGEKVAEVKKVEAKVEAKVVEAVKEIAPAKKEAVEEKKETAAVKKEAAAKKPAEKKAPIKKAVSAAKKVASKTTKKAEIKTNVVLEFAADRKYTQADLEKIAKDVWKYDLKGKVSDIKSMDLYVNAYESKVYYVINGDITGSFDI